MSQKRRWAVGKSFSKDEISLKSEFSIKSSDSMLRELKTRRLDEIQTFSSFVLAVFYKLLTNGRDFSLPQHTIAR